MWVWQDISVKILYPVVRPNVPIFGKSHQGLRIKWQKSLKQQGGPQFIFTFQLPSIAQTCCLSRTSTGSQSSFRGEAFIWPLAIPSLIISFLLSWDQFLWKALLFEKWKMETPKNRFNRFADTRHNYPWGNKAPMLWPRLTTEMNYYWILPGYQGAWLPNTSTVFLPPARLDHGALLWWESNQQTVEAPESSKKKPIKFFIKTESQIINLVSGQPHHSFKYFFHNQVRKYGRVLDEKLGNVGSGPGAITYWLCDLGQVTLPSPVISVS